MSLADALAQRGLTLPAIPEPRGTFRPWSRLDNQLFLAGQICERDGKVLYPGKVGAEFGTTTGRPRRCGWYDAVIARYAARVNGVTDFVLTKLDVLTGLEQVPVCVAYDVGGVRHDEMPVNQTDFHHAVPIYEYLPGWWEDISGARTLADLPQNAQDYVRAVEKMSGARISAVGVGPSRDATVVVHPLI